MKKILLGLGFLLFAGGCDQSVLAPRPSDISRAPWTDVERSGHFASQYSGHWKSNCYDASPGGFQLNFDFNGNEGSTKVERFEENHCEKLKRSETRYFSFKVIDAWKYNGEDQFRFVLNIVFDRSSEGDISRYNSTLIPSQSGFWEQGDNLNTIQNGKEVPLVDTISGGYYYVREPGPK